MTVVIADYGMGNVASIENMCRRLGPPVKVSSTREDLLAASRIILPGVGAFDEAMQTLRSLGMDDSLRTAAALGTPILGLCLGMQILLESSEEGTHAGLGLIPGTCRRFPSSIGDRRLLVPHMGWNRVTPTEPTPYLARLGESGSRYYFVHSFYAEPSDASDVSGTTDYGIRFPSAVARGNVVGVQFHPEKSHRFGMQLLGSFLITSTALGEA